MHAWKWLFLLSALTWANPPSAVSAGELMLFLETTWDRALEEGRPPEVDIAMAAKESRLTMRAISRAGACGGFQVIGRFLEPAMTCEELSTPLGAVEGYSRALRQWRAHLERGGGLATDAEVRSCYVTGSQCIPGFGETNLARTHAELSARTRVLGSLQIGQHLARKIRGSTVEDHYLVDRHSATCDPADTRVGRLDRGSTRVGGSPHYILSREVDSESKPP